MFSNPCTFWISSSCLFIRSSSLSRRSLILLMVVLSWDSWLVSSLVEVIVLIVCGGFVVDTLTTEAQDRLLRDVFV